MMRAYTFDLILSRAPSEDETDRLYGFFGASGAAPEAVQDLTLCASAGTWYAGCTVEAASLDEAVRLVLPGLRREGLDVVRVEVDREGLSVLEAA